MKKLLSLLAATIFLLACDKVQKPFEVTGLFFISNLPTPPDSVIKLSMNLDSAVLNGVEIPGKREVKSGYFHFSFRIRNNSDKLQRFYYKLFYQNESYKFAENHTYADENFYGSWDDSSYFFKPTRSLAPGEETLVRDSFKITGNPRNEKKFYGADPIDNQVNSNTINRAIARIKKDPQWVKQILEKSASNQVSVAEQFYLDAIWSLNAQKQRDTVCNNRWKRNPRVGSYEFMLVISGQEDYDRFPETFKDIGRVQSNGKFLNPFSYVLDHGVNGLFYSRVIRCPKKILVRAKLDLAKGIYVNPLAANKSDFTRAYFRGDCGDSTDLYTSAQMELFFHNINRDYVLHNVKEVRDVVGDNFTRKEYEAMATQYKGDKLIDTYVNATDCPCRNVSVDKQEGSLILKNPGNKEGEYKKEHVGVMSRVGFTYGKFRAKIKFPETLSKDRVWNGITNAFWLMAQDVNADWNMRRICDAGIAYIPKAEPDTKASMYKSKKQVSYSEIDFEILKESEFWPQSSYQIANVPYQTDDCANNDDIIVTCTNWDLACHAPEFYNIGAVAHKIDGVKYIHHRWNHWYKALTTKVKAAHDELFQSSYYYYEVEWTPEKITWRIGPEKDKMKLICVMDKNVTAIPNNQMLMIITQEWHNQEWWPNAPYKQNFIPFPKNDIIGKILELEIE